MNLVERSFHALVKYYYIVTESDYAVISKLTMSE